MKRISATPVILVGGKGERLGKDKVFLSLENKLVIQRTYSILETVFGRAPLFIGREVLPLPYKTIPDVVKGIGPKGGLLTAFLNTDTEFVFVTACDMPFINRDLLTYMHSSLEEKSEIFIPLMKNGFIEPLFAFYKRSLLQELKKEIKYGDYKMRSLLKGKRVRYLTEKEIEQFDRELVTFFNINTKTDLEKALETAKDEKD
ncbi:MAG: molybdenum cofactor guanylyltransferase [Caldisericaceae bacterium]|nr:molybdenum cofactor guanylyltransferase [Caldisericaceae bacterium]